MKLIVSHLISSLSLFQVCYMHISFLPVQLFYITLPQLLFSFSTVANSVADCLLRKVDLRQFVEGGKKPSACSQQTQTLSAARCRPRLLQLPLTALYEAGLQPSLDLCKSYLLGSLLRSGRANVEGHQRSTSKSTALDRDYV